MDKKVTGNFSNKQSGHPVVCLGTQSCCCIFRWVRTNTSEDYRMRHSKLGTWWDCERLVVSKKYRIILATAVKPDFTNFINAFYKTLTDSRKTILQKQVCINMILSTVIQRYLIKSLYLPLIRWTVAPFCGNAWRMDITKKSAESILVLLKISSYTVDTQIVPLSLLFMVRSKCYTVYNIITIHSEPL